jgi:hypothetical protein
MPRFNAEVASASRHELERGRVEPRPADANEGDRPTPTGRSTSHPPDRLEVSPPLWKATVARAEVLRQGTGTLLPRERTASPLAIACVKQPVRVRLSAQLRQGRGPAPRRSPRSLLPVAPEGLLERPLPREPPPYGPLELRIEALLPRLARYPHPHIDIVFVVVRGIEVDATDHLRLIGPNDGVRKGAADLELDLVPTEVGEVLEERRLAPRVGRAVRPYALVDRGEVFDDVRDREHPKFEPLVIEPLRNREVVGHEPARDHVNGHKEMIAYAGSSRFVAFRTKDDIDASRLVFHAVFRENLGRGSGDRHGKKTPPTRIAAESAGRRRAGVSNLDRLRRKQSIASPGGAGCRSGAAVQGSAGIRKEEDVCGVARS